MIEILLAIILGIFFGIITGLTPGLHVNTVGIMVFSSSDSILNHTSNIVLCTFFVTIAVVHAMVEFIPSLIFGLSTEDTITSIQPAHRLLFKGQGHKAIRLVSFGGFLSIILLILFIPLLFMVLPPLYGFLKQFIGYLLIITMIVMIYFTNKSNINRLYSLLIFMLSGILGFFVLNSALSGNTALLCILSAMFSISTLLYSITKKAHLPPQSNDKLIHINNNFIKSTAAGSISGCILGLLPGLGPAQGSVIAQTLTFNRNIRPEDFLLTNSGVNISDTIFSLIAIYLIGNPRSAISMYVSYLLSNLELVHVIFFICIALVSVSLSCIISIKLGDYVIMRVNNVNYYNLNILLVVLITVIVLAYSIVTNAPIYYVLICYVTSIALGLLPNYLDVSKSNLMGVLIVPSIITYLGLF
ncbi:MAG: tripartite tricarboxylate transporter permease [Methanosphaera sp.]|nr:tripartite tricarboxylate transporter permease [Methanosphaera sp.]